ncbi:E3 ubiquitin-protein ligase TRIM56-like [Octopus sinensis]|uniref:E3 ubiquitin-protein ligase TRIM56-like n=1 Tax=Octopus sinensis TaxID=2607531 RepID=A0A6P7SYA1_9MOLL|nr:E3 ubiquitin-protein ligase TRIM56-like [Octopus sinensis]
MADSATAKVEREKVGLLQEFSAELPDDEYTCRLHSILTIEDNNIAVIDFNNKRLKLFNQSGGFLHSVEFDHHPRRACLTPTKDIIVTLKGISQLAMIQYIDHQLRITNTIQTDKEYIDIDAIDHKRLVANMCGYIDVLNYEGKVLNRINHYIGEGTEGLRVKFPSSLRTRNNLLYTTEVRYNGDRSLGLQCMICCDLFGKAIFVYKGPKEPLLFPCGVTLDKYGNIYIACRVTSRIYKIEPNGSMESLLLSKSDGLSQPWCMWVTENMRLIFTEYESSIIRMFQLPPK